MIPADPCPFCHASATRQVACFESPPEGENRFPELADRYYRELWCCQQCSHYFAVHDFDLSQLYSGDYADQLYSGGRLKHTFEKIIKLPAHKSDNQGRVNYLRTLLAERLGEQARPQLLDIGSGLGVFPWLLHQHQWPCWGLDPDPRAAQHLTDQGIPSICADFLKADASQKFELLSFNKVLEHVLAPVEMLKLAHHWLQPAGWVYVELPDGEAAAQESFEREEFFIEHYHAFSASSFALLIHQAGFGLQDLQRLREPSGKYTLRGLAQRPPSDTSSSS